MTKNKAIIIRTVIRPNHIYMPENHMEKVYTSKNPFVRWLHNKRIDVIIDLIPPRFDDGKLSMLDVGCGEGQLLEKAVRKNPNIFPVGIDCTPIALKKAEERLNESTSAFSLIEGDITDIVKKDMKFRSRYKSFMKNFGHEFIICTEVIEHIPLYRDALKNMIVQLKKDGLFILTFPNEVLWRICRLLMLRFPIRVPDHVNSFNPDMMMKNIKHIDDKMELQKIIYLPFRWFPLTYIMVMRKK
jgi:2-polyprenyl-3-methyl-5-hydroxy-6-metoxy-1,4-benzoquinol methylase